MLKNNMTTKCYLNIQSVSNDSNDTFDILTQQLETNVDVA